MSEKIHTRAVLENICSLFSRLDENGMVFFKHGDQWILSFLPVEKYLIPAEHSITDTAQLKREIGTHFPHMRTTDISSEYPLLPPFRYGFFTYDFGRELLGVHGRKDEKIPLMAWNEYDCYFYGSPESNETYFVGSAAAFERISPILNSRRSVLAEYRLGPFRENHDFGFWEQGFDTSIKNIFAGEIYQVNLGRQFSAHFEGNSRRLFIDLWNTNPAPLAAFFRDSDYEILSLSPELFLQFDGDTVISEPIKGTRKRATKKNVDERERAELLASEKEAAELLMITDLIRNDLSQTCRAGSVKVELLRAIQENPTVWHTYSRISGIRRAGFTMSDTLLSCLPGGSISGCPKIRACEIIEEIEPHARGIFCGSMGFADSAGNGLFAILIRTLLINDGIATFQAAGGITAASEKAREAEELDEKCLAFFRMSNSKLPH